MGFYIRKSKSVGPVRFNASKSGLGVSFGTRGARVSFGPRGTYFHGGANGIYYRKKLNGKKKTTHKTTKKNTASSYSTYKQSSMDYDDLSKMIDAAVRAGSFVASLGDDSTAELPADKAIQRSPWLSNLIKKICLVLVLFSLAATYLGLFKIAGPVKWLIPLGVLLIALLISNTLSLRILYDLDEETEKEWNILLDALDSLDLCESVRLLSAYNHTHYSERYKSVVPEYYTNESMPVSASRISKGSVSATGLNSNVDFFEILANDYVLDIFPSCIYAKYGKEHAVHTNSYNMAKSVLVALQTDVYSAPSRPLHTEREWLHETRDGSPDLRYKDNPLTVLYYYIGIFIESPNGFGVGIATTDKDKANDITNALCHYFDYCLATQNKLVAESNKAKEAYRDQEVAINHLENQEITEDNDEVSVNPLIADIKENLTFDDNEQQH